MNRLRLAVLCLSIAAPALAQQKESWVGQTVLTKRDGAHFGQPKTATGDEVDLGPLTSIAYRVEAEEGDLVRVRQNGVSGWVAKSEVVRLSESVDYFTQEIRNGPTSAVYCIGP